MANPSLLLLDEPSEGLAPLVVANLVDVLGRIHGQGVTILLADQNLKFCRKVSGRGTSSRRGGPVRRRDGGDLGERRGDPEIPRGMNPSGGR